ncbi:SRPBCC family protein [Nitrosococcus wardiae]|uniref:Polyketide cyclase n=1 Tax=Nitrosococcus wardiae TaxID=1814290 RepID=A0A4V1AW74_9GAMM|nr:SRPBCC family protein [Nitrosococcus wardiae]QBQ55645.1 polyketide cyclase [Nitrosococcus wardiae]
MIKAQSSILVDRPLAHVFRYVSVDFFENYPKWSPEVIELEKITSGPVRAGTLARQVRIDSGRQTESTFQVVEYQPPRRIWFESTSSPHYRALYDFEPINETTRVCFTFELKLELFMRPFESAIAYSVKAGSESVVSNLKQLLESGKRFQSTTTPAL